MSTENTVYQPFTWLSEAQQQAPHAHLLELLCDAGDIAAGMAVVAGLVEGAEIDADSTDGSADDLCALLPVYARGRLQRLMVVSLNMLAGQIDELIAADDQQCEQADGLYGLARLVPENPCAGMMLSAEEAAGLAALRRHLQAEGGEA